MAARLAETCRAMVEYGEQNPGLMVLLCLEELMVLGTSWVLEKH